MIRAFDKRKVDVTDLDRITTEIEQTIQNTLEREISTDKIGEMVMERLKPLDEVAYIRFAPSTTGSRMRAALCGRSANSWRKIMSNDPTEITAAHGSSLDIASIKSVMDGLTLASLLPDLSKVFGSLVGVCRVA